MKNAIKYYYNIDINDLIFKNDNYYFDNYILKMVNVPIDIELYNYLINNNINVYRIINNKNNEYITIIDNKKYILLYKNINKINLNLKTVINNNRIEVDKEIRWDILWKNKIDYFEQNIVNIKDKELLSVYPYYIGLSENALRLFNEKEFDGTKSLSHKRIECVDDLFIPSNIIIDYRVRDIAEFIKYSFFADSINIDELFYLLDNSNLNYGDYYLLFVRLLFPSYFFDCIEHNKKITIYSSKINQYELFLNKIYSYITKYIKIPSIEWLIKR